MVDASPITDQLNTVSNGLRREVLAWSPGKTSVVGVVLHNGAVVHGVCGWSFEENKVYCLALASSWFPSDAELLSSRDYRVEARFIDGITAWRITDWLCVGGDGGDQ